MRERASSTRTSIGWLSSRYAGPSDFGAWLHEAKRAKRDNKTENLAVSFISISVLV
jgi:hypothetical protein